MGRGTTPVAGYPVERTRCSFWRFYGDAPERPDPGSPDRRRDPAPGAAPGGGDRTEGGVQTRGGVPAAADQSDYPAAILRASRASRRTKSRSPRLGVFSGRLPPPDCPRRAGGVAGAESEISAGRLTISWALLDGSTSDTRTITWPINSRASRRSAVNEFLIILPSIPLQLVVYNSQRTLLGEIYFDLLNQQGKPLFCNTFIYYLLGLTIPLSKGVSTIYGI